MQDFKKLSMQEFDNLYFEYSDNYKVDKHFFEEDDGSVNQRIYMDLIFSTVDDELLTQKICLPVNERHEGSRTSFSFSFKEIEFCCNLNFSIYKDGEKLSDNLCMGLFVEKLKEIDKKEEGYLSSLFMAALVNSKVKKVCRKMKKEMQYYVENPFIFNKI